MKFMNSESNQPPPTPSDLVPSSLEIKKALDYILRGRARSINSLRDNVHKDFYEAMDLVAGNDDLVELICDINEGKKLKFGQVRSFRNFLRAKFGEIGDYEVPEEVEYGNDSLFELGGKIRDLHVKTWFSKDYIGEFVKNGIDFVEAFVSFYNDGPDDLSEKEKGGVKTKTKKPGEKEDKDPGSTSGDSGEWFDDPDEQWSGFLKRGDIVTLRIIFSCIKSYLKSLSRRVEEVGLGDMMKAETTKNIWATLSPLVHKLKLITHMANVGKALDRENEYILRDGLPKIIESWEAYAINMADDKK